MATQVSDPYASIATPITSAAPTSASSDPYESIATTIPPATGTTGVLGAVNKVGEVAGDVATGFVKGAGDTVSGVSHLLHKIPVVGETLAPEAGVKALDAADESTGTAQSIGKGLEGIAEFATGDAALEGVAKASRLVSLAQKYPLVAKTLQLATEHPWLAKIITEGTKGAVTGGVEGTVKGAQKDEAVKGGVVGAIEGGAAGAAVGTVTGGVQALKNAKVNPFREILKGKALAQEPAEAAIREGVTAGVPASAPSVAAGVQTTPILKGGESILDEPLQVLENNKRALYKKIDNTVGFDYQEAQQGLKNDQYNLKQLGNTPEDQNARVKLINSITDTMKRLGDADKDLKAAGLDPREAAAANTSWKAGQDLKNVIVRNANPDGTINIDPLLKQSKMLRFSKRGDRILQFMNGNKAAADAFIDQLQAAQDAGVHAMKTQKVAKWLGGIVGSAALGLGVGVAAAPYVKTAAQGVGLLSTEP